MAKLNKEYAGIFLLFILVFGLRLGLVLQSSTFDNDSYFVLRQAENIAKTGFPLFNDPLSYSGRSYLFPPLFPYLIALFSFAFGIELAAKVATSLCFALIPVVVFMIAKHFTKNKAISLISAFFSGFVPVLFFSIQSISENSLSLVLAFLLSYCILRIDEKGFAGLSLFISCLFLLTSPAIAVFIFGLLFYFAILILEHQKPSIREVELTVFLFFLSLWFYVLMYKKAFFQSGMAVLWGNLPAGLLASYFQDISFIGVLYAVGVVPLLLGIYAIYNLAFETKSRAAQLYIGFALASFLVLWIKLVPLVSGLMFFSISIILLSAHTMKVAYAGALKMKAEKMAIILGVTVMALFVLTTAPHFLTVTISELQAPEDIAALNWIKENTNSSSVVLGRVEEGFLISYVAERKNAADANFLFIKNPGQTYSEISEIYNLRLKSEAVRLLNKYGAGYIFLSEKSKAQYGIDSIFYADTDCFEKVYDDKAIIYQFKGCRI